MLNDQGSWSDECCELSVSQLIELAENVSVNGFDPHLIAFVEITADQGRLNARVQCGGV